MSNVVILFKLTTIFFASCLQISICEAESMRAFSCREIFEFYFFHDLNPLESLIYCIMYMLHSYEFGFNFAEIFYHKNEISGFGVYDRM